MKAPLYDGSRRMIVDTSHDTCLLSGPQTTPSSADVQFYQKDLYLHRNKAGHTQYYFHIRPSGLTGKDKVVPVLPGMAERYLLRMGITCDEFKASEPVLRLYNWGYGIAGEF